MINAATFNHVYIFYDKVTMLNTVTDTCIVIRQVLQCPKLLSQTAYSQVLIRETNHMIGFGLILILVA